MEGFDTEEIRSIRLFAEVAEEHLRALIGAAVVQRVDSRTLLAEEGEQAEFLHILLEGSVELFARTNEQETTITILRPVSVFLLPAVVAGMPYVASARTLKRSRVLAMRADAVRNAFDADAAFARAIVCELSRGFRRVLAELKNQKLRTSTERLADWLLRANAQLGDTGRFTLPSDKRTLASLLGMTPENLSRSLKTLSERGVVVHGRDILLKDPAGLARIARGENAGGEAEL